MTLYSAPNLNIPFWRKKHECSKCPIWQFWLTVWCKIKFWGSVYIWNPVCNLREYVLKTFFELQMETENGANILLWIGLILLGLALTACCCLSIYLYLNINSFSKCLQTVPLLTVNVYRRCTEWQKNERKKTEIPRLLLLSAALNWLQNKLSNFIDNFNFTYSIWYIQILRVEVGAMFFYSTSLVDWLSSEELILRRKRLSF